MDAFLGYFGDMKLAPLAIAVAVMFGAGFVKGSVGFGLPMIAISGIGSVLPAPMAIAAVIAPSLAANLWQAFRQGRGPAWRTLREFWLLNLVMFVMIALSAQLVLILPERLLFLMLGGVVSLFGAVQFLGWKPPRPVRLRKAVELAVGLVSGFFGGLTGVWGPPILLYLIALDTPRQALVRAQGVSFLIGSIILSGAHVRSGLLLGPGGVFSLSLVIPCALGMALGLAAHDRMDQRLFRRVMLAVLVLAGLNLLRRGIMG